MDDNALISVIVPVYNVENYLYKCISSIITQSYGNFELILIDDGSIDKSGEICDSFSEKDNRIKVIHKVNEGVSSARNYGLKQARGEYICFIIRKSKFPQNPKRSVRFSGKRTKRSVQKRKARNTQKAETKVL